MRWRCGPNREHRWLKGPWPALGRIRAVKKISIPAEKADSPASELPQANKPRR
jgi:hypothetical protein